MMPHPVTSQTFLPTAIQGSLLWGRAAGTFCSKRQQARAGSNLKSYLFIEFLKNILIFFLQQDTFFFHIFHILSIVNTCIYVCMYVYMYVCMRRQREKERIVKQIW